MVSASQQILISIVSPEFSNFGDNLLGGMADLIEGTIGDELAGAFYGFLLDDLEDRAVGEERSLFFGPPKPEAGRNGSPNAAKNAEVKAKQENAETAEDVGEIVVTAWRRPFYGNDPNGPIAYDDDTLGEFAAGGVGGVGESVGDQTVQTYADGSKDIVRDGVHGYLSADGNSFLQTTIGGTWMGAFADKAQDPLHAAYVATLLNQDSVRGTENGKRWVEESRSLDDTGASVVAGSIGQSAALLHESGDKAGAQRLLDLAEAILNARVSTGQAIGNGAVKAIEGIGDTIITGMNKGVIPNPLRNVQILRDKLGGPATGTLPTFVPEERVDDKVFDAIRKEAPAVLTPVVDVVDRLTQPRIRTDIEMASGTLAMIENGKQAIRLARDYGDYTKIIEFSSTVVTSAILVRGVQGGVANSSRSVLLRPSARTVQAVAPERATTFRNLAPLDDLAPSSPFPLQSIKRGYTGKLEYVVLETGELVFGKRQGHINLSRGADVLAAGEVKFFKGAVKRIDNTSGHYRPTGASAQNAAEAAFNRYGFNATGRYVERKF